MRAFLAAACILTAGCVDDSPATDTDGGTSDAAATTDGTGLNPDVAPDPDDGVPPPDAAPDPDDGVPPPDAAPDPDDGVPPPDAAIELDVAVVDPDAAPPIPDAAPPEPDAELNRRFSFFVTSLEAIRELSRSEHGFGGNFGGLAGADGICQTIARGVGQGHKEWRAFLSVTDDGDGNQVHAIERIGEGPWYDANGRLVSENIAGLMGDRPDGDERSILDLPTEHGLPVSEYGDAHDVPTGSNQQGRLNSRDPETTCNDWTSDDAIGQNVVMCGHTFPRRRPVGRGANWMSDHPLRGCTPGVNLIQNGPGEGTCIGCSGGYGGLYCFALSP